MSLAVARFVCRDCGEDYDLSTQEGREAADEHWRVCETTGASSRRLRTGLVEGVLPASWSSVSTFDACKRKYLYRYVLRIPAKSGDLAALGTALHAERQADGNGEAPRVVVPLGEAKDWKEIQERVEHRPLPYLVETEAVVEWTYEIEGTTIVFQAKIDAYGIEPSGRGRIRDYKSGRKIPNSIEDDGQLKTYALGLLYAHPEIWEVEAELVPLRGGRPRRAVYSVAELLEWEAILKGTLAEMLHEREYRPEPADQCRFCDYLVHCDAGQRFLGPGIVSFAAQDGSKLDVRLAPITSREDAENRARAAVYLKTLLSKVEDQLEDAAGWLGPILIGPGQGFAFRPTVKKTTDYSRWEEIEVILRRAGKNPDDYRTGNGYKFRYLLDPKSKEFCAELANSDLVTRRVEYEFDYYRNLSAEDLEDAVIEEETGSRKETAAPASRRSGYSVDASSDMGTVPRREAPADDLRVILDSG